MSLSRRKFMSIGAMASAGIFLPYQWLPGRKPLFAASKRRRHLINLVCSGGWDSSWFHSAFSEQGLAGVPDAFVSTSRTGFEHTQRNARYRYTQKCASVADEAAQMPVHPNGASRLGPAMRVVFPDLANEVKDFVIWKGLKAAGGHTVGNNLLLQGNSSSYAISYSGLISQALSEIDHRPLHYVLVGDSPSELFTNAVMNSRDQIPTCIPSEEEFKALSSMTDKDLASAKARDVLTRTVTRLTEQGLRDQVKQASSRGIASSYLSSVNASNLLYGANFRQQPLFKWLIKYYHMEIYAAFKRAGEDPNIAAQGAVQNYVYKTSFTGMLREIGSLSTLLAPLPALDVYLANPAAFEAGVSDVENTPLSRVATLSPYTSTFYARVAPHVFNYALADFLVRSNLSAVVDVPGWVGTVDAHGAYMEELLSLIMTFASFRALINSLKKVPAGDGGSLFDATLIAMHSEFDRLSYQNERDYTEAARHPGTDHAESTSVILAGYGVRRGTVVGDVNQGPKVHPAFTSIPYLEGLPIDLDSGKVMAGGQIVSTLAVMPTIMEIFGVMIPSQQLTDWHAVPAVIDPKRS